MLLIDVHCPCKPDYFQIVEQSSFNGLKAPNDLKEEVLVETLEVLVKEKADFARFANLKSECICEWQTTISCILKDP
jgi:hypothetical protein